MGTFRGAAARGARLVRRSLPCVRPDAPAPRRAEAPAAQRLNRDEEITALLREARAIARVRHPNVVPIYGVDRHDGRVGFWSDFVQGKTLAELLAAQGPLGPARPHCRHRRLQGGRRGARGGIPASRHQGRQRDARGGRPDPADGFRTHARDGTDEDSSGTPAYMAPELLLGQPATIASDVYAIGVMLFNLLTASTRSTGRISRSSARPMPPANAGRCSTSAPICPRPSPASSRRRSARHPKKRFASTGQMIAALSEAIGLGSGTAVEPASRKSHAFVAPGSSRRSPWPRRCCC